MIHVANHVAFYIFVLSTKFGLVFILWWCRDWVYFYKRIHQTLSAENSFTLWTLMACTSTLQPPSVSHLKSQSQLWAQSAVLVQSHHKQPSPQDCFFIQFGVCFLYDYSFSVMLTHALWFQAYTFIIMLLSMYLADLHKASWNLIH